MVNLSGEPAYFTRCCWFLVKARSKDMSIRFNATEVKASISGASSTILLMASSSRIISSISMSSGMSTSISSEGERWTKSAHKRTAETSIVSCTLQSALWGEFENTTKGETKAKCSEGYMWSNRRYLTHVLSNHRLAFPVTVEARQEGTEPQLQPCRGGTSPFAESKVIANWPFWIVMK